jgi:trehalose 6-phosphate synthase
MVDEQDRIAVPPDHPEYTLRRIRLCDEELNGYYYGFANEGLWPLCHIAYMRPMFRSDDWQHYVAVNRKFADAVAEEARQPEPLVLVQDYHFALLPQFIRERIPGATVVTFWHIPWPNAEAFGICPWREEILSGLLGSSIIGFHTQSHCNNFFDTVDRFLECRIDRDPSTIAVNGDISLVRPYPISIEWPPKPLERQAPVAQCRAAVLGRLGLPETIRLGVGVERFDYTKGILDRFRAVAALLEHYPDWRGRFVFVQVAAPSRSKLPGYQQLQADAATLVEDINQRFGGPDYQPIVLLARHHEPDQVFELFRAADVCVVSSLHDGMNLVAKEFVAARDDERGVLILSAFAGASRELHEALIVNPYDTDAMAEGLALALTMPPAQQQARMRLMRDRVRDRNVYRWAGHMLLDAAHMRKRLRIVDVLPVPEAPGSRIPNLAA